MNKRVTSLVVMCALILGVAPSVFASGGVSAKLYEIQQTSGYKVGTPQGNCYLFAKDIFKKVYGTDSSSINYHGDYEENSATQLVGRLYTSQKCGMSSCDTRDNVSEAAHALTFGEVNEDNILKLLELSKPGDVLQGHRGYSVHTMIVLDTIKSEGAVTGVTVYHGNYGGIICVTDFTLSQLADTYSHVLSLYRAKNYVEIDDDTDVTFNTGRGSVIPQMKKYDVGTEIGELPRPYCEGFEFIGWTSAEKDGTPVTETSVFYIPHVTLYAEWKPIVYTPMQKHTESKQVSDVLSEIIAVKPPALKP
ncbi:MAG: InlB B-repeat-containing protein [Oscillospiraceae bacterium]